MINAEDMAYTEHFGIIAARILREGRILHVAGTLAFQWYCAGALLIPASETVMSSFPPGTGRVLRWTARVCSSGAPGGPPGKFSNAVLSSRAQVTTARRMSLGGPA